MRPLHHAYAIGMMRYLILHGANVNARGRYGRTLLHEIARRYYRIESLEYLLTHGADAHIKDNDGMTALDYVIAKESKLIERMEGRSDVPEWYQQRYRHDMERLHKAIALLRGAMG